MKWLIWLWMGTFVLVAPALLFPTGRTLWVVAALPVVMGLTYLARAYVFPHTPINSALMVLIAMLAASTWASFDLSLSLGKLCGTVLGMYGFFLVVEFIDSRQRLRLTVTLLIAFSALLGVAGLSFAQWKHKVPILKQLAMQLPTFPAELVPAVSRLNTNPIGGTMLLATPIALALVVHLRSRRPRTLHTKLSMLGLLATFLVLILVVLLSQSYSAWGGLFASLVVFALGAFAYGSWEGGQSLRRKAHACLVALLGVIFLVVVFPGILLRLVTVPGRASVWEVAHRAVRDFPVMGGGMDTFAERMVALYPILVEQRGLLDHEVAGTHNLVLQTTVDLGLTGLVASMAIWAVALGALLRVLQGAAGHSLETSIALGCLSGLVGHLVYQIADSIPLGAKVGLLWWIVLGIAMTLYHSSNVPSQSQVRAGDLLGVWILVEAASHLLVPVSVPAALALATAGGLTLGVMCLEFSGKRHQSP